MMGSVRLRALPLFIKQELFSCFINKGKCGSLYGA